MEDEQEDIFYDEEEIEEHEGTIEEGLSETEICCPIYGHVKVKYPIIENENGKSSLIIGAINSQIKCPVHGDLRDHEKCKEEFVKKAREVHGDKYGYDKTEIFCAIQEYFWRETTKHYF